MTVPLLEKRIKYAFGIEEMKEKYADMGNSSKQKKLL
jgi:hypothetical protein